jgi:hypothetical protein
LSQEVEKEFISSSLSDFHLMRIPEFSPDRFDIVNVHGKVGPVELGTIEADEGSESHIEMS